MRWSSFAPLALSAASLLAGCGGGGCLIDSDCPDFQEICVERRCVSASLRSDGGEALDASPSVRDAGRTTSDAGARDAGPSEALDAAVTCEDLSGSWSVSAASGECGAAAMGHFVALTAAAEPCDLLAVSDASAPAIDGTLAVRGGVVSGDLSVGALTEVACTGTHVSGTISLTCGECTIELGRAL
jgi:hypothetical protein